MSSKSRRVIYGGQIIGAKIRAESARKRAAEATCEADRGEAEAWSIQMEGYGGHSRPRPLGSVSMAGTPGLRSNATAVRLAPASPWMRSGVRAALRSGNLRRRLNAGRAKKGRYAPPVHMIKFTQGREITPYLWTHPDDDDRR
jgi:hypothetical protein